MATAYTASGTPADDDVPDDAGVDQLIDSYRQPAFNLAYRLVRRHEDAADAVQDAFVLAMRASRGTSAAPREPGRFRAWLLKIVANVALAQLRRRKSGTSVSLDAVGVDLPDRQVEQPLTALMRREQRGDVLQALLALPDAQRAALALREYQGLSYDEIGEMLGLERGAITALLYRARAGFRAAYTGVATRTRSVGCSRLAPLISAMLDAELEPATWKRVDRHVLGCHRCRRELKMLRSGQELRSLIPLLAPPAGWSTASTLGAAGATGAPAVASLVGKAAELTRPLVTSSLLGAAATIPGGPAGTLGPAVERGLGKLAALAAAAGLLLTFAAGGPSPPQTAESAPLSAPADVGQSGSAIQVHSTVQTASAVEVTSIPEGAEDRRSGHESATRAGQIAASAAQPMPAAAGSGAEPGALPSARAAASAQNVTAPPIQNVMTHHDDGGTVPAGGTSSDAPLGSSESGSSSDSPDTVADAGSAGSAGQSSPARPDGSSGTLPPAGPSQGGSAGPGVPGGPGDAPPGGGSGPGSPPGGETPPSDPPTVEIDVAGLPPIDLSIDLPPLDLSALEVPPIDVPPVDVPPVDLAAVDLPPVDLPAVDLSTIAVGEINLPAVDLPAIDVPAIDLPPIDLAAVDLPPVDLAEVPLVDGTLDQVRDIADRALPGGEGTSKPLADLGNRVEQALPDVSVVVGPDQPRAPTIASGNGISATVSRGDREEATVNVSTTNEGNGTLDASVQVSGPAGVTSNGQPGSGLVDVNATAGAGSSGAGQVESQAATVQASVDVNGPGSSAASSSLVESTVSVDASGNGLNTSASASIDAGTNLLTPSDTNSSNSSCTNVTVSANVDAGSNSSTSSSNSVSASTSVSLDAGSNGSSTNDGNSNNSTSVNVSVSLDTGSNSSGNNDSNSSSNSSNSLSVSVSVDTGSNSSSNNDSGNNGSNSNSNGGINVSVGGISISLP